MDKGKRKCLGSGTESECPQVKRSRLEDGSHSGRSRIDKKILYSDKLHRAFTLNFKAMANGLSAIELIPELISSELLTTEEADEIECEKTKAAKNFRLLFTIDRKANANKHILAEFLQALERVNCEEPGCHFEHIIEGICSDCLALSAAESTETVADDLQERLLSFYELIKSSIDAQHILSELISKEIIDVAQGEQVFNETTSERRTTCLLDMVQYSDKLFNVLESETQLRLNQALKSPQQQPIGKYPNEAVAFRRAMGKFGASLTEEDVNNLIFCLYSGGIISKSIRNELVSVVPHCTPLVRKSKLLCHLETRIEENPSHYKELIEICSKELHLKEQEAILRMHYGSSEISSLTVEKDLIHYPSQGLCVPTQISEFSQYLKELYKLERSQKWQHINSSSFYINLAIIKRNERITFATADPFTRETIERNEDVDSILKSKEQIEMDDVLKTDKSGGNTSRLQVVLVQGAPGVGKSTFALEMAKKWSVYEEMKSFHLVLLVQLRQPNAHNANSLNDLLQLYSYNKSTDQISDFFMKQQGEGLLLILDGFDELPSTVRTNDSSIYIQILQNKYLPKATVILTTRPSVISCIQRACDTRVSKHIEIVGFLSPQIDEFVHKFLGTELAKDFLQYIYSYPHIKSMMYIPLNTTIMVNLYSAKRADKKLLPMTLTQLYSDFCLHLLHHRVVAKHSKSGFKQHAPQQSGFHSELDCMPGEVQTQVKKIAGYAFQGIMTQKVVFYDLNPDFDHMDLMTKYETLILHQCKSDRSASFNFLHLTVQEFLAAFHISCMPAHSQKDLLKRHHSEQHFSRVWRFLAGLTAFKQIEWKFFVDIMTTSRCGSNMQIVDSLLANCLYEAQDPSICCQAYSSGCTVYSPMSVTHYDYYSLGYCIANSSCSWKLCGIGGDGLAMLAAGIKSVKNAPKGKIELIKLSYNGEKICNILELPECMRKDVTELNLGNCGLDNSACNSLAGIIPLFPNINRLDIADNPFTEGGATSLLWSVSRLTNFTYLDLLHAKLSLEDLDALSALISINRPLKNLIIGSTTMSTSVAEKMLSVILVNSQLRSLSIMNLDLAEFGSQFGKVLEKNETLDTLMLWDRSFCIEGCIEVVRALQKNHTLKILTLMPWYKFHIPESLFKNDERINWFYYPKQE